MIVVDTPLDPPKGPVSIAVRNGPLVWTAQIPKDPINSAIIEGGIEPQTHRTLENLRLTLEAAGGGLKDVVQVTVYLVSSDDAQGMNLVWREFFRAPFPNRATVVVKDILAPGALIEIVATAYIDSHSWGEAAPQF